MVRFSALTIVLILGGNLAAAAGCNEDLPLGGDESSPVSVLQYEGDAARGDGDCCTQCFCCARILDDSHRVPENASLRLASHPEQLKIRLVEGYLTLPYHPPQVIG
jgi:hypothetical protein